MTDMTGMPLDLLLVRHGESEGNVALAADKDGDATLARDDAYRQRSTSDYRLSELGVRQALTAGDWIRNWMAAGDVQRFDRLYCSPFVRTRETAASLGLPEAQWQLEPLLRERDWGLWEGRGVDETKALFPISSEQRRRNRFLWRPECGESTPDMDLRVRDMLATFARELSGRRVICVTHEDTMWAFRLRLEKWTLEHWNERRTDESNDIHNCGILHYTRVRSDGTVADRFDRIRVIDPLGDGEPMWETIERPLFSDDDLMGQVEQVPHLWMADEQHADPVTRALGFAAETHAGQVDKLGRPYLLHVGRVVERVGELAPAELSEDCQVAAALHDVVEDCDVLLTQLDEMGFSAEVVSAVDSVTRRSGEDYFQMVARAASDPVGRWVKLADNLDNSDPSRAALLDPGVRARLAEKYRRAREILAAAGAAAP